MEISFFIYRDVRNSVIGIWLCLLLLTVSQNASALTSEPTYLVGLGSYDITGPAADVNMMGYANMEQIASGIHFRLRARAFIVAEPGGKRVVFVNLDACMASQIVTIKVIERLKSRKHLFRRGALAHRLRCCRVTLRSHVRVLEAASCKNAGKGLPTFHPCGETLPQTLVARGHFVHRAALFSSFQKASHLLERSFAMKIWWLI